MARKRKQKLLPPPKNTRALARRLWPQWTRAQQAQWVVAKLRTESGTWRSVMSEEFIETHEPDFLRRLPEGATLEPVPDLPLDKPIRILRYVRGMLR